MSKRILVVFFVTVVLTATAAFGQLVAPQLTATTTPTGGVSATATSVTGATGYKFEFKDRATGTVLATQDSATPQATLPPTANNLIIDIRATAHNATATSPTVTAAVTFPPPPPTNISGRGGKNSITVSWTAVAGATSYQLTLSNGMSFTTTATSYIVTGLPNATSYNLIMASINAGGRGVFSGAVVVRSANIIF